MWILVCSRLYYFHKRHAFCCRLDPAESNVFPTYFLHASEGRKYLVHCSREHHSLSSADRNNSKSFRVSVNFVFTQALRIWMNVRFIYMWRGSRSLNVFYLLSKSSWIYIVFLVSVYRVVDKVDCILWLYNITYSISISF